MLVECEVEIKVKDRDALAGDEHEKKLWLQRSFKNVSCYRISDFKEPDTKLFSRNGCYKNRSGPGGGTTNDRVTPQRFGNVTVVCGKNVCG